MSWNYRVIKRIRPDGQASFGIHAVHYRDGALGAYLSIPSQLKADSVEELATMLLAVHEAFDKPVLTPADFPTSIFENPTGTIQ